MGNRGALRGVSGAKQTGLVTSAVTTSAAPTGGYDGEIRFVGTQNSGQFWVRIAGTWYPVTDPAAGAAGLYTNADNIGPKGVKYSSGSAAWSFTNGLTNSWSQVGLTNGTGTLTLAPTTFYNPMPSTFGVFTIDILPVGGTIAFGVGNYYVSPNPEFSVNASGQITSSATGSNVLATVPAGSVVYYGNLWGVGAYGIWNGSTGVITGAAVSGSEWSPMDFGANYGMKARVKGVGTLSAGQVTPLSIEIRKG